MAPMSAGRQPPSSAPPRLTPTGQRCRPSLSTLPPVPLPSANTLRGFPQVDRRRRRHLAPTRGGEEDQSEASCCGTVRQVERAIWSCYQPGVLAVFLVPKRCLLCIRFTWTIWNFTRFIGKKHY